VLDAAYANIKDCRGHLLFLHLIACEDASAIHESPSGRTRVRSARYKASCTMTRRSVGACPPIHCCAHTDHKEVAQNFKGRVEALGFYTQGIEAVIVVPQSITCSTWIFRSGLVLCTPRPCPRQTPRSGESSPFLCELTCLCWRTGRGFRFPLEL
jgi:hypothetical protein